MNLGAVRGNPRDEQKLLVLAVLQFYDVVLEGAVAGLEEVIGGVHHDACGQRNVDLVVVEIVIGVLVVVQEDVVVGVLQGHVGLEDQLVRHEEEEPGVDAPSLKSYSPVSFQNLAHS